MEVKAMEKNLRVSSFIIPVKVDDKKYMLIHGYSGAMDIVDEESIKTLKSNCLDEIKNNFTQAQIQRFINRGYLTCKSIKEEQEYVRKISNVLIKRNKIFGRNNYTLLVTYNCNFNCPYCFEKNILAHKTNNKPTTISKKFVDKFYNTITEIEKQTFSHSKTISLFGGEPLLKENREIVEYIIKTGVKTGYRFIATTNGYDLDSYQDLLGKGLLESIQITLDGSREIHDKRRTHIITVKSFDKIITNVRMALNRGVFVTVRVNIDADNVDEIIKLNDYFTEQRLFTFKNFSTYAAYISGEVNFNPESYKLCSTMNDTQRKFMDILKQADIKIGYEHRLYSNIMKAIKENKGLFLTPCYCNANYNSYIFDPYGNIYSCLEVVGNTKEAIGKYINGIDWNISTKEKWTNRNVNIQKKCSKCKYSLLCGGGCFAKAQNSGNENAFCDDFPMKLKYVVNKIYPTIRDMYNV